MMKRAPLAIAVALVASLFGGCTPELTDGHFACEDGRCPSGWFCRADRRCYSTPGGSTDAGGGEDAGPFDGGGIDGGALDAGPTDGGAPGDTGPPVDAGPCDPAAQTGCSVGERCTLVNDGSMFTPACASGGSIGPFEPCATPPTGMPDDCMEGLLCVAGVCRALCTVMPSSCGADYVCTPYSSFPDNAGLCDPTCDPVRQTRDFDGSPACGSTDPTTPSHGCYGPTAGPFVCAPVFEAARTRMHRDPAGDPVFLNSCAPGFMPLLMAGPGDTTPVCIALCDPETTYSGNTGGRQGLSPYACPNRGATATSEECRFFDSFFNITVMGPEVGLCFDYMVYGIPSCESFTMTADSDSDTIPDYVEAGCGPA